MTRLLLLLALVLAGFGPGLGLTPLRADDTMPPAPWAYRQLDDPKLEAKAQGLMETIRCLTCQSQSIADSDASMAGDMRSQIRERIAAGEQPEAIREWLIQRYGDYITYTPRVSRLTWPLFAAPLAFLLLAGFVLRKRFGAAGTAGGGDSA
jgi:cytochrome c-type biogenesis protein CcmH/NrfF